MSQQALSNYTVYSRYAHFLPEKQRRENWSEIVDRVFGMHERRFAQQLKDSPEFRKDFEFAKEFVRKKRVLGSQRALQFGGPWIEKHELKIFNCSTTHVNRPRVFQEIMYALLCGVGMGFSVQRHHVEKLPKLRKRTKGVKVFKPEDSIEGWADAIGVLVNSFFAGGCWPEYEGYVVEFDLSNIRRAGELIAGQFQAPGPEGLKAALEKIEKVIVRCGMGRRLRPIDAYDIIMHASDAVLSGGVRRSATIAIFSPDDHDMLNAKTGNWFDENPQRARSNNSAALLKGETTKEQFSRLMKSTKEFGEPGFIWLENKDIVYNPCCISGDSYILTDEGPRKAKDLGFFNAVLNGKKYKSNSPFFVSGQKELFRLQTIEGFDLDVTKDHRVMTPEGWVPIGELCIGDQITLNKNPDQSWEGFGNRNEGWLVGSLLGDGTITEKTAYLDYWGDEAKYMPQQAIDLIYEEELNTYKNITGSAQIAKVGKVRVGSAGLKRLAEEAGVDRSKKIGEQINLTSSEFICGFLSGWFDADGSVQGDHEKGISIRLSSSILSNLKTAQRLLLNLGIYSRIYQDRHPEGARRLPDGHGGIKEYYCEATHELVISRSCMKTFQKRIGFSNKEKSLALFNLLSSYKRTPSDNKFVAHIKSFDSLGVQDVYDCEVDEIHAFDANGFYVHNCEISMIPELDGESGIQVCNLTEINGRYCDSEERFLDCCRAAAIVGTLQAHYTNFKYLTDTSKKICDNEALLGCSITGIMDNPDILLDSKIQRKGAKEVLKTNAKIAEIIGINPAARTTCVKPAGSTSCVLQTASGVHPHHAKRYIRRTQANKMEFPARLVSEVNPLAVERSVWSANDTDLVISFLCEVPAGAILKNQIDAVEFLDKIRLTQTNWVEKGTRPELGTDQSMRHNVSCTVTVHPHEWDAVEKYIFKHQKDFAGISLLPASGDLDYPQAPFATVLTPTEIVREYGDASVFASGLVVDGLSAFDDDLWEACNCVLGIGQPIDKEKEEPLFPSRNGYTLKQHNEKLIQYHQAKSEFDNWFAKKDWLRRAQQFSERYFNGNLRRMTYCLKHVSLWKTWCDLQREYVDIDWSSVVENDQQFVAADTLGAVACSGGSCELV